MARDRAGKITGKPSLAFGSGFLADHAGNIIRDPRIALVELVANAYDAGATRVEITLPVEMGKDLVVRDNGIGMTREELESRWNTISYQRLESQGLDVEFPPGVRGPSRTAFGRNGKGRLAGFCFANTYVVETRRAGKATQAEVRQLVADDRPYVAEVVKTWEVGGTGTTIELTVTKDLISEEDARELLGTKFLIDPSFTIVINGQQVRLLDLDCHQTTSVEVPGHGRIEIMLIDGEEIDQDRRVRLRGIAWWVNNRMVGTPTWEGLDGEGNYLDGRGKAAKRFAFVVRADLLKEDVMPDWSGFYANARLQATQDVVHHHVVSEIRRILSRNRKETKIEALQEHGELIRQLPVVSREVVGQFVDLVQEKCPTISPADLSRTAGILAKLESARSGYELLERLVRCSPNDLDTWNEIMSKWSADQAMVVLDELEKRLALIDKLQRLVNDPKTDELHDLQPLFERGLWIFGPEFESVDFRSNRGMATIVHQFFSAKEMAMPSRRPDLVALRDGSLGIYAAADFSDGGELSGYRKVLVVELKKGGFEVTQKEMYQGNDYSQALLKAGSIQAETVVVAYVLGSSLANGMTPLQQGGITVRPLTYDTLLARAHSRTFNLKKRVEEHQPPREKDSVMEQLVQEGVQSVADFKAQP